MTAMTKANGSALTALTVGQVAEQLDVTVRTLHHYDEIGLSFPSNRGGFFNDGWTCWPRARVGLRRCFR
jgi:hypothetical protein